MKKIFEHSNGTEFYTDNNTICGNVSKEEALDTLTKSIKEAIEIEDVEGFQNLIELYALIRMSYVEMPIIEIEIIEE